MNVTAIVRKERPESDGLAAMLTQAGLVNGWQKSHLLRVSDEPLLQALGWLRAIPG